MPNYIVLGAQWGDEGKGKIVDLLAGRMDMVVRFQGGANAGHTVVIADKAYILHLIPGGVVSGRAMNVIGNGCVVDPLTFCSEMDYLQEQGITVSPKNLAVSAHAHVVTPLHKFLDNLLNEKIGTTRRGIGPAYADKIQRTGIRLESILNGAFENNFREMYERYAPLIERVYETNSPAFAAILPEILASAERMKPFISDTTGLIASAAAENKSILFEGAQGTLLDVDHGTYPFVTSSSTSIGGAYTGGGVFLNFDRRIGLVKAYTTRVGEGPFPTEQENEIGQFLREKGHEFGATTGRPRRCGWLDLPLLNRSVIINGFNYLVLSKLSCLSGLSTIRAAVDYDAKRQPVYRDFPGWDEAVEGLTDYDQLPANARDYIRFIEEYLKVKIGMISTGPDRNHYILRELLW